MRLDLKDLRWTPKNKVNSHRLIQCNYSATDHRDTRTIRVDQISDIHMGQTPPKPVAATLAWTSLRWGWNGRCLRAMKLARRIPRRHGFRQGLRGWVVRRRSARRTSCKLTVSIMRRRIVRSFGWGATVIRRIINIPGFSSSAISFPSRFIGRPVACAMPVAGMHRVTRGLVVFWVGFSGWHRICICWSIVTAFHGRIACTRLRCAIIRAISIVLRGRCGMSVNRPSNRFTRRFGFRSRVRLLLETASG